MVSGEQVMCLKGDFDGEAQPCKVSLGDVLEAFIGSRWLPSDLADGIIEFKHESTDHTYVNTCAPSITFSNISKIQDRHSFEQCMIDIVYGAKGFGLL